MSLTISFPHWEAPQIITKNQFDCIYNKFGAAIYGLSLRLTDKDPAAAQQLMQEVFVELFFKKTCNSETVLVSFAGILQIIIKVANRNGYNTSAFIKALCTRVDQFVTVETCLTPSLIVVPASE